VDRGPQDLSAEIGAFVHEIRAGLKNHIILDPAFAPA
jgi:hypothetical protein